MHIVDFVVGSVQQFEVYMRQQELFVVQIVVGRNGTLMFGKNILDNTRLAYMSSDD